jgi:hypothetical protein
MAPVLRKVETEVLIPRQLEYKITHELCSEEARLFAECAKKSGFRVIFDCKDLRKKFEECSNKYWRDEATRKKVEEEYLEKRRKYKETGVAEKSPFSRI